MDLKRYLSLAVLGVVSLQACSSEGSEPENRLFISAPTYAPKIMVQTDEGVKETSYDFTVGLVSPLERDIKVRLEKAPALLENYRNGWYDATALLLPEENFSEAGLETEIVAGAVSSRSVSVHISGLDKLDYSTNYVLPLTIADSDGVEVMQSAKTVYVVISEASLINVVGGINDNLAWVDWKDKSPLKDMTSFTMEVLFNANAFANDEISTIMGIEDNFLIRVGDANYPKNMLNIAYGKKVPGQEQNARGSIKIEKPLMEAGVWNHIAVSFDNGKIDVYLNGRRIGGCEEAKCGDNGEVLTSVDFTTGESIDGTSRPDEDDGRPRAFWFGYSYDDKRDFDGLISEARIWNKALTVDEINAPNHFWKVRPDSEGLVAYWKFNDGSGNVIKDHSPYGNDLNADHALLWVGVDMP